MRRPATRTTVMAGLMGALLLVLKETLAVLPGEPVTPLILLYTLEFPAATPWAIGVFVVLQFVLYGFGLWSWMYLYIWFLLFFLVRGLRKMDSAVGWAVVSAAYGLAFGALCAPVYLFTGGWAFALTWWVSGIPFDLLHAAGNFVIALALFKPLQKLMETLYARLIRH